MRKELWEQNLDLCSLLKEVMPGRRYRKTKGELVRKFKRKEKGMSPEIDTDVREGADDVTEDIAYEITNVEDITTDVQNLSGIRVSLLSVKAEEGNVVLWKRKVTGHGSKLGVFIDTLGKNTDGWLHQWVVFSPWQPRNRGLKVVPAPSGKELKAREG